jgi:hypothetical protein
MKSSKIFKEPLFQFFLIGIIIYALYGLFAMKATDASGENMLVVTEGDVSWMTDSWTKRWNRPPTDLEFAGLITQHIEESILYQEALKMGLDRNDVIIRRRLAQKLRFLQEDLVRPSIPEEEELGIFFNENIDKYRPEQLITITQIFFDPDKRDEATLGDAENAKKELIRKDFANIEPANHGDNFMLQNYYPGRSQTELAKLFGSEFAQTVMKLKPEQWHGPVLSGYGTHLVYISDRIEPVQPVFEDVKEVVLEDWRSTKQQEINNLFIEGLLSRYSIVFEDGEGNEVTQEDLRLKSEQ